MKTTSTLLWMILVLLSFPAFSQETTSEIRGVVSDQNGGVAGATVIATHTPTGTKYSTTTRKDGRYNLPNARIGGPYDITVTFVGYKTETQQNITLLLGQEFNADIKLIPSSAALEGVTVVSTRPDRVFNSS